MAKTNWIQEMIEREAIPEILREETTGSFCKKHKLSERNYYYHCAKPEHQKQILEIALNLAKKHTPEILHNLAVRAKSDNKASEMFLEYILKFSKQLDIKSNGQSLVLEDKRFEDILTKYGIIKRRKDSDTEEDI